MRAKYLLGLHYYFGKAFRGENGERTPDSVVPDQSLALLWFGRAAESGDPSAQYNLAVMMEKGQGLPNQQPEIAERYWRLAAYAGDEDAEVEFADRLRLGSVLVKPENGSEEAVKLLQRAVSQASARAALQLARIYRDGVLGEAKDPIKAMQYAYLAIKLSTEANPTTDDGNPFREFAAGILIAEMVRSGEATGPDGQQLLTKDQIEHLDKFYGKVDPETKQVKVRRLDVPLHCYVDKDNVADYNDRWEYIWVWDWGREESPTEPQFRSLEQETSCQYNGRLRGTLTASFALSRKNNVPFADLIDQQIKTAQASNDTNSGMTRHRRWR
ncbi:MAG: DUF2610 domain-containing protein [Beijerinckiaceae bacterium]